MDNPTLTRKLKRLAKLTSEAAALWSEIDEHSMEVYGARPSDVDCDEFLDSCTGVGGQCTGMTAAQFDKAMRASVARSDG